MPESAECEKPPAKRKGVLLSGPVTMAHPCMRAPQTARMWLAACTAVHRYTDTLPCPLEGRKVSAEHSNLPQRVSCLPAKQCILAVIRAPRDTDLDPYSNQRSMPAASPCLDIITKCLEEQCVPARPHLCQAVLCTPSLCLAPQTSRV